MEKKEEALSHLWSVPTENGDPFSYAVHYAEFFRFLGSYTALWEILRLLYKNLWRNNLSKLTTFNEIFQLLQSAVTQHSAPTVLPDSCPGCATSAASATSCWFSTNAPLPRSSYHNQGVLWNGGVRQLGQNPNIGHFLRLPIFIANGVQSVACSFWFPHTYFVGPFPATAELPGLSPGCAVRYSWVPVFQLFLGSALASCDLLVMVLSRLYWGSNYKVALLLFVHRGRWLWRITFQFFRESWNFLCT